MPVIHGRFVCVSCGNDLGPADDYHDPAWCPVCEARESDADIEHQERLDEERRELEWRRDHDLYEF
jgi:hypothetical protein